MVRPVEDGARVDQLVVSVVLGQGPEGEALADVLLVGRVDVVHRGDVRGHGHTGMGNLERFQLGLPDPGQGLGIPVAVVEGRELNEVEGKVGLFPYAPPSRDEGLHLLMIEHAFPVVGFPLVPKGSLDGIGEQGGDHGIVHVGGRCPSRLAPGKLIQLVGEALPERGNGLEAFRRGPGLDAGASPIRSDQADGRLDFLLEMTREVVAYGGEVRHGGRAAYLPAPGWHVVLRGEAQFARNLDVTDQGVLPVGDFLLRIARAGHGPFHVGLPRAKPDLAHQDVFQLDLVGALDGQVASLGIGLHGGKIDPPLAVLAGLGRNGFSVKGNGDFLAFVGPAPDGDGFALLENHMVAENRGQLDFGGGKEGGGEERQAGIQSEEELGFHKGDGAELICFKSLGEFGPFGKNAWPDGRKNFFRMVSPR